MRDLMETASAWLDEKSSQDLSRAATYRRGEASCELTVQLGRSVFDISDEAGGIIEFETRDYLFAAEGLVLGEAQAEPQPGDRIEDSDHTYEVLSPGNEKCWRWSDGYWQTMRVHTKEISAEE